MSPSIKDVKKIKEKARQIGFELVGIASPIPPPDFDYFCWWLDQGYGGTMTYLKRGIERRRNPELLLPHVKSIICCGLNYHTTAPAGVPKISRHAWGEDYHHVVGKLLDQLEEFIQAKIDPSARTRCFVDTGAILERSYASEAGLGWIGKNNCLINGNLGSYFFLGEILTNLDLPADSPAFDQCGTCTKCLTACPTEALVEPYVLDARKCIAYLTLEYEGEFSSEEAQKMGGHLYGCDICQEVCPYNQKISVTPLPEFQPVNPLLKLTPEGLATLEEEEFRRLTSSTTMSRLKFAQWQRNLGD